MKTLLRFLPFLALAAPAFAAAAPADRPNIVFILADDLGWADTTPYGHTTLHRTPHLERLARRGLLFTRAYSASPLCSPTRASILTGQTPARTGITSPNGHSPNAVLRASVQERAAPGQKALITESVTRLDPALPTLGRLLKQAGYATGHFGKWHLGPPPYSPLQHGFDVDVPHFNGPGPAGSFVAPWRFKDFDADPAEPHQHIEDRMAKEAVAWMKSLPPGRPFFLNYWMFSVHAPFDAKRDLIEKYRAHIEPTRPQHSATYAAMIESMDAAVGSLLDAVDRASLADRTVFVFTSDNGGNMYNGIRERDRAGREFVAVPTSNHPLRGGKATVFEGGIRVPAIVAWPGLTAPGTRSDALVQSTDYYPTLLARLGLAAPPHHAIDGIDLTPALRGGPLARPGIFTFFPHHPPVPDWLPASIVVHSGDWKLIRLFHQGERGAHAYRLYHLQDDLGETRDLAAAQPARVRELDALIEAHLRDTRAVVPQPNPAFDPALYQPEIVGIQPGGLKVAGDPAPKANAKAKKK